MTKPRNRILSLLISFAVVLSVFAIYLPMNAMAVTPSFDFNGLTLTLDSGEDILQGIHYSVPGNNLLVITTSEAVTLSGTASTGIHIQVNTTANITLSNVTYLGGSVQEPFTASQADSTVNLILKGNNAITGNANGLSAFKIMGSLNVTGDGSLTATHTNGSFGIVTNNLTIGENATVTANGGIIFPEEAGPKNIIIALNDRAKLIADRGGSAIALYGVGSELNMNDRSSLTLNSDTSGYGIDLGNPKAGTINIQDGLINGTNTTVGCNTYTGNDVEDIGGAWVNAIRYDAAVDDVTISGRVNSTLNSQTAIITLVRDKVIAAGLTNMNAESWFTDLPTGIAVVANGTGGGSTITLTFGGTPSAVSTALFNITLPISVLESSTQLAVAPNADAKYAIEVAYNTDATITGGSLADVALAGTFTGGTDIADSSALTVTVLNAYKSDAALLLTRGSISSTIKYVIGSQPESDTAYANTWDTTTKVAVNNNDVIWLLVTAEDSSTKLYYKITVTVDNTPLLVPAAPITGVTSPVANATPSTVIDNGVGFTAALSWNGNPTAFGNNIQYTAQITLTADTGYTFTGDYRDTASIAGFTVNGNAPTAWVSRNATTLVFTVTFPATDPVSARSATVANVAISGVVGSSLSQQSTTITLTNATVRATGLAAEDASGWFANLPTGVTVTATSAGGGNTITLTFGGTPSATSSAAFDITIPATVFTAQPIIVTPNQNAKFNIVAASGDTLVTAAAIGGVTSPVANATPSTGISNGTGFTAALTWDGSPATFGYSTQYTATITLTAATGYTFSGGFADTAAIAGFTVNSIAPVFVSNTGATLVFTVAFPATGAAPADTTKPTVTGVTPSGANEELGGQIAITFSEAMNPSATNTVSITGGTITGGSWSVNNTVYTVNYSGLSYGYTATITISGFADVAGNVMNPNSAHGFITKALPTDPDVSPLTLNITTGGTASFTVSLGSTGATNATVVSSDADIATVSTASTTGGSVTVTGVSAGNTTITVTFNDTATTEKTVSVTVTDPAPTTHSLTVSAGVGGSVSGTTNGNYAAGQAVSITATASTNYTFASWTANGITVANTPTISFNMPGNAVTLIANFQYTGGGYTGGGITGGYTPTTPTITGSTSGNTTTVNVPGGTFISVTKNGQTVPPQHYTVGEMNGKLTVTFTDEYLATLGTGNHTHSINTTRGTYSATVGGSSSGSTGGTVTADDVFPFAAETTKKITVYDKDDTDKKIGTLSKGADVTVIAIEDGFAIVEYEKDGETVTGAVALTALTGEFGADDDAALYGKTNKDGVRLYKMNAKGRIVSAGRRYKFAGAKVKVVGLENGYLVIDVKGTEYFVKVSDVELILE